MSDTVTLMKEIGSASEYFIEPEVFDFFIKPEFMKFIENTFISGGSSVLKGKKVEETHITATTELINSLRLNSEQRFLHVIGLSGSGKSEIRKQLPRDTPYFPLDERLKPYLSIPQVQAFPLFQTDGKFDAKKFEYAMYCAAFASGKYTNYIIDHSGGSPLQPGLQALVEGLAGNENHAIHLDVDKKVIADNIANTVMYDNWTSVKEPVRDSIGVELGLVAKGYEKTDPSRATLAAYEKGEAQDKPAGIVLADLRARYRVFCDANIQFSSTTERMEQFAKELSIKKFQEYCERTQTLTSAEDALDKFKLSDENKQLDEELEMLRLHRLKALEYVEDNEWRRDQFSRFNRRTKISHDVDEAARMIINYMGRKQRVDDITKRLNSIVTHMKSDGRLNEEEALVCQNLTQIEDQTDVYLFDMHGVIHSGGEIPQKTLKYLEYLRSIGKTVVIASNDVRSGSAYIDAIAKDKGLIAGKHFDYAITSGDVFARMLKSGAVEQNIKDVRAKFGQNIVGRPIRIFIQDDYANVSIFPSDKFTIVDDIDQADAVLTGSPRSAGKRILIENEATYLAERKVVIDKIIERKLPIIVPNPDTELPFDAPDFGLGYQTIGSGRMADICEADGVHVIRTGKPSSNYYDCVKQLLAEKGKGSVPNERIAMIGDSFGTDIIGANDAGFRTVAVANDRSNVGLMVAKREKSFIECLPNKRTRPSVFIQSVI